MQSVSKQRLGKHTSAYTVTSAATETVFSMWSVQGAVREVNAVTELVQGQLRVSRKLEELVQKNF
jgi:hypothetical protein